MQHTQSFSDRDFFIEEILNEVAEKVQLTKTMKRLAEDRYSHITKLIEESIEEEVIIYPQGSYKMKTTSKPFKIDEYDIDFVVEIDESYFTNLNAEQALKKFAEIFRTDMYKNKIEIKKRCLRLNYANEFHMDFTPTYNSRATIKVPDCNENKFCDSNPKGYMDWFERKSNIYSSDFYQKYEMRLNEIRNEIEELEVDIFEIKPPLKRAVQLVKRARDVYFYGKDNKPSSILLTTLFARYTEQKYFNIYGILKGVTTTLLEKGKYADGSNPLLPGENFAEIWKKDENYYHEYFDFLEYLDERLDNLRDEDPINILTSLFGEKVIQEVYQQRTHIFTEAVKRNGMVPSQGNKIMTGSLIMIISNANFSEKSSKANTFYG